MQQHTCPDPPDGRADRTGAVESLLVEAQRLRRRLRGLRDRMADGGGDDAERWQRALFELAERQLDDLTGYLEEARALAADEGPQDPAAEADERFALAELEALPSPGEVARMGRLGTAEWDLVRDRVVWSREAYRLLGRDEEAGPLTLDQLPAHLLPEDQQRFASMITSSLVDGRAIDGELRIARPDGGARTVHCVGEPVPGEDGTVQAIWMLLRDVSDLRRDQRSLRDTRETLIRERRAARTEHRRATELQRAVLPRWPQPYRLPRPDAPGALELAALYLPSPGLSRIGGDWYDAFLLPDGDVQLTFGGVAGHGPEAAAAMAAVRGALRALAVAGATPAAVLAAADRLLARPEDHTGSADSTASTASADSTDGSDPRPAAALCLRYRPNTRALTWAQAGHPAPLLFRRTAHGPRAVPLDRLGRSGTPSGRLLGTGADATSADSPATPAAADYGTRRLRLAPGDLLLCYPDSIVRGRSRRPGGEAERLLSLGPLLAEGVPSARDCLELARETLAAGADASEEHPPSGSHDIRLDDDLCLLAARVC